MITYVNTVLVSNKNGNTLLSGSAAENVLMGVAKKSDIAQHVGKFVLMNCDPAKQDGSAVNVYTVDADTDVFKIGVVQSGYTTKIDRNGAMVYVPMVKWSNEIKVADIKSLTVLDYKDDTEDEINIDFSNIDPQTAALLANGGIPVILRLTFKDTPTRYRKWSESYDYYTKPGDTGAEIAAGLANAVSREIRRARVTASATGAVLTLTAMPYDDDNSNDSENFTAKVRFNANVWFSDPKAPGFASNNKYALGEISKNVGINYPASGKNVRDHERTAQGYLGILHRKNWYDAKPAIIADIDYKYSGITLEFENMYRTADDLFRKTKQTVEIYCSNNGEEMASSTIAGGLAALIGNMIASRQKIVNPINNSAAYDAANF